MKMEIENYLIEKGIFPNLKGFDMIAEAVRLIRKDITYKYKITTKLYPKLAETFKESKSKVERAIRYSIERAGHNYTNSEFIALAEIETRDFKKKK